MSKELELKLQKTFESFEKTIANIRTGRANPAMIDNVRIELYGAQTSLKAAASVNTADVRTLKLTPFDPKNINAIEKAITEANLGLSVRNDGHIIHLSFPPLTEERRLDLIKQVKNEAENSRVAMRNQRRDYLDGLKKKGELSKDELKGADTAVQKIVDSFMKKIDDAVVAKEKAISQV
jgi:ribosome recycling factor